MRFDGEHLPSIFSFDKAGNTQARGEDLAAMIRHGYGSRTNYLLFCNSLNKAENVYNLALLPKMQGERDDLLYVIEKMHTCVTNLRRKEADRVFP